MKPSKILFLLSTALALAACAVGPDYKKPEVAVPADWRWKKAEPKDALPKGDWWAVFHDEELNALMKQAVENNQELRAALARVDELRAKSRANGSQFVPTVSEDASASRSRTSANAPLPLPVTVPSVTQNAFTVPMDLSYEVDLWGRVRRSFEASGAEAQASAADFQNVLLTLTADVATRYFELRELDTEVGILRQTLKLRDDGVEIQTQRFKVGLIPELDLARAQSEDATAKSDLADVQRQRAEMESDLALLCGQPASTFEVKESPLNDTPPEIPAGLPSDLLERRPDIARAERTLAARNAEIGVAYAAFFPTVRLTGQAGYLSMETKDLFDWDSSIWSFGPSISLPLFTGGRNQANLKSARAAYNEAVAQYRQQVLVGFRDVETSLSQIQFLDEQSKAEAEGLVATRKAASLAEDRYRLGTINYFEVIDTERSRLQSERDSAKVLGNRLIAAVRLIEALGGGWHS